MSKTRKPRGVRATEEGLKKLRQAQAAQRDDEGRRLTYPGIAEKAGGMDSKTVGRFFRAEAVDRDSAIAIVQALGLEITEVVDPKEWNPVEQTSDAIDWHEVCGKVLAQQLENQRIRRQATERGFELNVYVPLGLVERKQQQRRRGDVPLEEVYQLTEEVITKEYDNDKFLTEVIEPGRSKRIAIIGEPGAGKTTLQEKIAVWIHDNNKGLPICIPLGRLQGKSIEDYLLQIWLKAALRFIEPDASGVEAQHIASLQKQFREGKVWLLLDGVDEMAATSAMQALATIKEQLTDWLVEARVVLTCRLNVWDANVNNTLIGFETYRTLEFKPEQAEDFIRQWFACAKESQRGEELLRKLQETGKERIRELVRNPLRLSLLCQTSYVLPVDEPLPETKAALYERFTRYFYEWKQEQHPTTRTERRQLNQALGELAKAGINSKARFRLGEDLACDVMGEPLFDLAWRLGWLNLVDREAKTDEAVYAFYHPTFQEYFAACAINDWRYFLNHDNENPNPLLNPNPSLEYDNGKPAYRIFEPQWKEVILLWLGRPEQKLREHKEQFIQSLVEFEDGCGCFYWHQTVFFAAAGIAEFGDSSWTREIVTTLVMWSFGYFLNEDQEWEKSRHSASTLIAEVARETLTDTNRSFAIAALIELLNNTSIDEETRGQIVDYFGYSGIYNSEVIDILIKEIDEGADDNTRFWSLWSLKRIAPKHPKASIELTDVWTDSDREPFLPIGINNNLIHWNQGTQNSEKISTLPSEMLQWVIASIPASPEEDFFEANGLVFKLGEAVGDAKAIETLIELIRRNGYLITAAESLMQILQNHQFGLAVSGLKDCLIYQEQIHENVFDSRYEVCYQILWHCAQNMTYRDFYKAWVRSDNSFRTSRNQ